MAKKILVLFCFSLLVAGCQAGGIKQDLSHEGGNWLIEQWENGAIRVDAGHDGLSVTTHSKEAGVMLWLRRDVSRNFAFDFVFRPLSQTGFFLLFFCAQDISGSDVLGESAQADRSARTLFKKYTEGNVRCYHISYRRGEEANCNLRKNPGLILLKQETLHEVLPQGRTVHVKLRKRDARISLEVDGKLFMEYTDSDRPLFGGRLGLRPGH